MAPGWAVAVLIVLSELPCGIYGDEMRFDTINSEFVGDQAPRLEPASAS